MFFFLMLSFERRGNITLTLSVGLSVDLETSCQYHASILVRIFVKKNNIVRFLLRSKSIVRIFVKRTTGLYKSCSLSIFWPLHESCLVQCTVDSSRSKWFLLIFRSYCQFLFSGHMVKGQGQTVGLFINAVRSFFYPFAWKLSKLVQWMSLWNRWAKLIFRSNG